jgi:phospholipid/cholesterol/gamma-HCH transport system substrate-binding protein
VKISKEFKIGIIVTAAIGLFIWGFNFLKGSNLFSEKYELYAVYPKIDGLIEANPLLINGFKVGQISKISLVPGKNGYGVLVKFLLTEDVKIPKHSVARAVSSDLLGSRAVEIIYSNETEFVESGDTLIAETEEGLKTAVSKQLAPLQAKIEGLLSSVDSVMTVVQVVLNDKTRENLSKSFESIKLAIQSLEQTAYKLDDLVASEKAKISGILTKLNTLAGMLEKNTGKIDNIIGNFSSLSDSLAKSNLKSAIDEADKTLSEFNKLVAQINSGQGTLGKLVKNDSLYNNLNKASEDLDKLMKDLRINPERYIHLSVFGRKDKNKPKL